jgi:Arc/MetJ-type ribon-helix-helix transcriptional regulator
MGLKAQGRTTISVHINNSKVDFLDEMIARSGVATSAYFVRAALEKAVRDAKAAGLEVPENITADIL